jgi:membrane-associated protease RseP (regulator of RpoE activity)
LVLSLSSPESPLLWLAVWLGVTVAALVVHELGQLVCAVALKVEVRVVFIGAPPVSVWFRVGKTRVALGTRLTGHVSLGGATTARRAAVAAAGPVADLAAAGVALALPVPRPVAYSAALVLGAVGIVSLLLAAHPRGVVPLRVWECPSPPNTRGVSA